VGGVGGRGGWSKKGTVEGKTVLSKRYLTESFMKEEMLPCPLPFRPRMTDFTKGREKGNNGLHNSCRGSRFRWTVNL